MADSTLANLPSAMRTLLAASLARSDARWDASSGLLHLQSNDAPQPSAIVRETTWYSLGLLQRDAPGDRARAAQALAAVLPHQIHAPGMAYHGTFARYVGEPPPPGAAAVMWRDYDPNWRQFIGTTLAMIVTRYADRLPSTLVAQIEYAIRLAVMGEPPDRCPPWYANIALMKAGLLAWAGERFDRADWRAEAVQVARAVAEVFFAQGCFFEYNSPTYYGVNLYALGFWRTFCADEEIRTLGRRMEDALWRDIAAFYHPGLHNVCGPFMRAYGMDMTRYAALLGMSIWGVLGREAAPFPDHTQPFDHDADFVMAPCMAAVGMEPPDDAVRALREFVGPHEVTRTVATEPLRRVTAWLGEQVMAGAEAVDPSGLAADDHRVTWFAGLRRQYHPLTLHWRARSGGIGTLRLVVSGPVNARVEGRQITLQPVTGFAPDEWRFEVALAVDASGVEFAADCWSLDGLALRFEGNAVAPEVTRWAGVWYITLPALALEMRYAVELD